MRARRGFVSVPARSVAVVVLCGIALASGLAGAAIDRMIVRADSAPMPAPDTAFHPLSAVLRSPTPQDRRALRAQLARELGLSATQVAQMDTIMDRRAGEFNALRDEIRPRVERLVSSVRSDIEGILTPAQRERFRRLQQFDTGSQPDTTHTSP
ncbi:MAG TPA: hypothetical protein VG818_00870 [Gemmatimonadaceae bacterium]|jgi:hypothetical protein|nr:hypothetical protein [Gemmatimonadaceae bacterium]